MSPEYVRPYVKAQNNHDRVAEAIAEAASTTWLSIPSDRSTRWIQKTSRPVSWMTIIGKSRPVRAAAFRLSSVNRRNSPHTSPAQPSAWTSSPHPPATGT